MPSIAIGATPTLKTVILPVRLSTTCRRGVVSDVGPPLTLNGPLELLCPA